MEKGGSAGSLPAEPASEEARRMTKDLFEKYGRAVFSYFVRRGLPVDQAEDLAQETFLRVHSGSGTYRRESEWNYLLKIAERVRLNAIRSRHAAKRKAETSSLDDMNVASKPPSSESSPEDEVLRSERIEILRSAIEDLPEPMRDCLKMRLYKDLKYREVAVGMGLSVDAVKKLLYLARRRLIEMVGPWVEGQFEEHDRGL